MPSPVRAETATPPSLASSRRRPFASSRRSILFITVSVGRSSSPSSSSTRYTADICSSRLGVADVHDVEQELRLLQLLERRLERRHELRRELPDEAHRVGEHERRPPAARHQARRGIERDEQLIRRRRARAGDPVEQCRLARVRVPDQRHDRQADVAPVLPEEPPVALHVRAAPRGSGRSDAGSPGGPTRAASRPVPGSRSRRPGARGGPTGPPVAAGGRSAAPAPPGACPRSSARAGRRCRGSAPSGRSRARFARRAEVALLDRASADRRRSGASPRAPGPAPAPRPPCPARSARRRIRRAALLDDAGEHLRPGALGQAAEFLHRLLHLPALLAGKPESHEDRPVDGACYARHAQSG